MTTAKNFHVVFTCANKKCGHQAIWCEVESMGKAEQRLAYVYDHLDEPILATCPNCNQTRRYCASKTNAYIQEILPP